MRFESLVRRADLSGAWALLTDGARSRYLDMAGFQPAFDRLGEALGEAGTNPGADRTASSWLAVNQRLRYNTPSEVVVVGYATGRPQVVWPMLIQVPVGQVGDERIDPEPPRLRLAATSDGDGIRVELADGDLAMTSFVIVGGAGQQRLPSRQRVAEDVDRLTWSIPLQGPVVAVAIEESDFGLRVAATIVDH